MNRFLFYVKRLLLFLADVALWPVRTFMWLWHHPERGRALLFGLPALLITTVVVAGLTWGVFGSRDLLASRYNSAAKAAEKEEEWERARVYLEKLLELKPANQEYQFRLFVINYRNDNADVARAMLQKLAPEDSVGYPNAHIFKADVYLQEPRLQMPLLQRLNLAHEQLRLALMANPESLDARIRMAEVKFRLKRYNEAEEIYKDLFTDYPAFVFRLAEIHEMQNRQEFTRPYLEQAIGKYNALIEQYPKHAGLWQRMTKCYMMLDRYQEIEARMNEAQQKTDDAGFQQQLIALMSDLYAVWALSLYDPNDMTDARAAERIRLLQEGLRHNGASEAILVQLTMLGLEDSPAAEEARKLYNPYDNPDGAPAAVLKVIGTHEVVDGNAARGIELLEKGVEKNPNDHEMLNNLAFALIDSNPSRALELANRAIAGNPGSFNYFDTRGHVYMAIEDYAKASADLERAKAGMPDNLKLHQALEECYRKMNLTAQAELYQKRIQEIMEKNAQDQKN